MPPLSGQIANIDDVFLNLKESGTLTVAKYEYCRKLLGAVQMAQNDMREAAATANDEISRAWESRDAMIGVANERYARISVLEAARQSPTAENERLKQQNVSDRAELIRLAAIAENADGMAEQLEAIADLCDEQYVFPQGADGGQADVVERVQELAARQYKHAAPAPDRICDVVVHVRAGQVIITGQPDMSRRYGGGAS